MDVLQTKYYSAIAVQGRPSEEEPGSDDDNVMWLTKFCFAVCMSRLLGRGCSRLIIYCLALARGYICERSSCNLVCTSIVEKLEDALTQQVSYNLSSESSVTYVPTISYK